MVSGLAQFPQPNYRYGWPLPGSPWRPQGGDQVGCGDLWRCVGSEHQPHESHLELTNSYFLYNIYIYLFLWNLPWRIKNHSRFFVVENVETTAAGLQMSLLQPGVSLAFCLGAGVDGASALAASSSPEDRLGRCFGLQPTYPTFNIFNGSVGAIP